MSTVDSQTDSADGRVCVDIAQLVRLQYQARALALGVSGNVDNALVGRHRSHVRGRGLNFEELRHYRVGDDIRQMDWKVTNRTRKPHIRVYAEERERPVILAVDQRLPMFFGSRRVMKSVAAAEMAAIVGWKALSQHDRVGALIFGDDSITELAPERSQAHMMRIFQQLQHYGRQLQDAQQGSTGKLNEALRHLMVRAKHDSLIYLITDLDGADDATGHLLTHLAQHNDVIVGMIYDPLEQRMPRGGKLAVSDGEFQVEVDTDNPRLREKFERTFEQRLLRARQFLRSRNIPILPIDTVTPVVRQLLVMLSGAR